MKKDRLEFKQRLERAWEHVERRDWKLAALSFEEALYLFPKEGEIHLALARVYSEWGQADRALQHLENARRYGAVSEELDLLEAELRYEKGEYKQSLELLRMRSHPSPESLLLMGWNHYRVGEHERARELFQEIPVDLKDPERALGLGLSIKACGDLEGAVVWLRRAVQDPKTSCEALVALGEIKEVQGEEAEAVTAYRRALLLDPSDTKIKSRLAILCRRAGEMDRAETLWRDVLDAEPLNDVAAENLSDLLALKGEFEEAEALLRRAADEFPANVSARIKLGGVLSRRHAYDEAETLWLEAVSLEPGLAEGHLLLGDLYTYLDRKMEAAASYQRFLCLVKSHPEAERVWVTLGDLTADDLADLLQERQVEQIPRDALWLRRARGFFESAIAKHPENPFLAMQHARVLNLLGDHESAIKEADRSLKLDEMIPESHFEKGVAFLALNRLKGAAEVWEKACFYAGDDAFYEVELASLYCRLGKWNRADGYFRRVLQSDPNHTVALAGLALVCRKRGRDDQALALWQRFLDKNPNHLPALLAVAEIHYLQKNYAESLAILEKIHEVPQAVIPLLEGLCFLGQGRASAGAECLLDAWMMDEGVFEKYRSLMTVPLSPEMLESFQREVNQLDDLEEEERDAFFVSLKKNLSIKRA